MHLINCARAGLTRGLLRGLPSGQPSVAPLIGFAIIASFTARRSHTGTDREGSRVTLAVVGRAAHPVPKPQRGGLAHRRFTSKPAHSLYMNGVPLAPSQRAGWPGSRSADQPDGGLAGAVLG